MWEYVSGTDGQITFTNNLAMGDYVAVYLRGRKGAIGNTVEFSVVSGIDNGAAVSEVSYLFQTYIPAWNNYFGKYLSAPGLGTLIEYNGNYHTVFHAIRPDQPPAATGQLKRTARSRWVYIAPVKIDFTNPETDANKWINPMKPTTNRPRVN